MDRRYGTKEYWDTRYAGDESDQRGEDEDLTDEWLFSSGHRIPVTTFFAGQIDDAEESL